MDKATKTKIIVSIISVIILVAITLGLLFAYRMDIFVNHNRDTFTLELNDKSITIPMKHKYLYYTPTNQTIKTDNTVEEIYDMFVAEIADYEELRRLDVGEFVFFNLYKSGTFAQSISLSKHSDKEGYIDIDAFKFIPLCIYGGGNDFSALYQDRNELVDGREYTLNESRCDNAMDRLNEYMKEVYQVNSYNNNRIELVVNNKTIVLTT